MGGRTSGASDLIDLDLDLRGESAKAYKVSDGKTTVWLPKSQVEYDGRGTFTLPEWLATEKGLT